MPLPNDPTVFTHNPDDYSDEFIAAAFLADRWQLSGGLVYTLSSDRARVAMSAGGSNDGELSNLVTLPITKRILPLQPDAETGALYHLADLGAVARDASGNGNDGIVSGMVVGQPGVTDDPGGQSPLCMQSDTSTDNIDIIAVDSHFKGDVGSYGFWYRAPSVGTWTNGLPGWFVLLQADASNTLHVSTNASDNLRFTRVAGGTGVVIEVVGYDGGVGWHYYEFTWDEAADEFKAYIDAVLIETKTTIGTWVGSLTVAQIASFSGTNSQLGYYDEERLSGVVRNFNAAKVTDLELQWETSWDISTDFAVAGQEATEGLVLLFQDGSERRLLTHDGFGFSDADAELQDELGATLGSTFAVTSGTDLFFRIVREDWGQLSYYARQDSGDAWTLLHREFLESPIVGSEFRATRIGATSPAWSIEYSHDYLHRVIGVRPMGSTMDQSYAFGTVADEQFSAILDKLKPSGLKIEIV